MVVGLVIGLVVGLVLGASVVPRVRRSLTKVVVDLRQADPEVELPPIERRAQRAENEDQPFRGRTWT